MSPDSIFSAAELAEVLAYHQPRYLWALLGPLHELAVMIAVLTVGIPQLHRAAGWTAGAVGRTRAGRSAPASAASGALTRLWNGPGFGQALLFTLFVYLLLVAVHLPIRLYLGYAIEHRFGLSNHTPGSFAWDLFKSVCAGALARTCLAFGMYGLIRRVRRWWLWLGVPSALLLLVSATLDPARGRLFYQQHPLEAGPLRAQLVHLLARAEVSFADIAVLETSRTSNKVQAFFAGQGPTRTIVLNDVLLQRFEPKEVLAAVAHEAGHVKERRWPSRAGAALALLGFLALCERLLQLAARRRWWGVVERGDVRTLPMLTFSLALLLTALAPLSAVVSRGRELEADRYAVSLTGDPEAFRAMLVKAARTNKMDPSPPRWYVLMGASHPPLGERLARLGAGERAGASPTPPAVNAPASSPAPPPSP